MTAREHLSEAQAPADCPCHTWAGLDLADWPEGGHHRLCDGQGGRRHAVLSTGATVEGVAFARSILEQP